MSETASNTPLRARLREHFEAVVRAQLKSEFGYTNDLAVPKLEKIVINMGVGETTADTRKIQGAVADHFGIQAAFVVPIVAFIYVAFYGLYGYRAGRKAVSGVAP